MPKQEIVSYTTGVSTTEPQPGSSSFYVKLRLTNGTPVELTPATMAQYLAILELLQRPPVYFDTTTQFIQIPERGLGD